MNDAIIFSSFVPSPSRLWIAIYYLDLFEKNFADCDLYIGVSHKSCQEWIDVLKSRNLNFSICDESKFIDSDACGYQEGLRLLRDSGKKHKTILFAHTKFVTHPANDEKIREDMETHRDAFLSVEARNKVSDLFNQRHIGLYSNWCTKATDPILESLDRFYDFWFTGNKLMVLESIYFMRGSIVHQFIHNCKSEFFDSNLLNLGFDRYFFERDFPTLCFRFGYEYSVKNFCSHPEWYHFDENEFHQMIHDWRERNNIHVDIA